MAKKISYSLSQAKKDKCLVRLTRRFETSPIRGYVLDIGPNFFLLALLSDRLWFDGFECFRIKDLKTVRPDPYQDFAMAALRKRGERMPRKPRVRLASIRALLTSAGHSFPLVTVHREEIKPASCWIGKVLKADNRSVSLLEIGPDAVWDKVPNKYRLSEITRVNFGGDYENALDLVGGVALK